MSRDGSEEFGRWDIHGPDGEASAASDRSARRDPSRKDPARKDPSRRDPSRRDPGGTDAGSATEDATWRELVARLELPSYIDPKQAPWPERENLGRRHAGPAGPSRVRVIRPATGAPFTGAAGPAAGPDGQADELAATEPAFSDGESEDEDYDAAGLRDTDLDGAGDYGDEDDRYVPPPLPPLPKLDPTARAAWAALFGGPGFLLLATMFGWPVPGWAELIAVSAFVAGFATLVFRLGDGPSRRDGPDQGAVVLAAGSA